MALEGGQVGVQWYSDGERGGEGSEAWRREDSQDERPYPSAGDFYDQRWLAAAVSVVFLLCASGSTFPTELRGIVLAALELWLLLLWTVAVAADWLMDSCRIWE